MKPSIFVVDSDVSLFRYVSRILSDQAYAVRSSYSGTEALQQLKKGYSPALTLVGSQLPDVDSVSLIRRILHCRPQTCVVLMPYMDGQCDLPAAIRAGACRVLSKPFVPEQLAALVSELCQHSQALASKPVELRISDDVSFVYASSSMREIQQQAALVAPVSLPVLILGESGTGKEVIARYIHAQSRQAKSTFLKVNCAAVPSELLESELFGYEQGAFTGAGHSKPGKFKLCDNGTMFLDEIGEMHPSLQAKLLQVLQDGTFTPLGSRNTVRVKVRIIAATNIDMKAAIAGRTFREDLFYRLNGFSFKLPPLRERRDDIPILARHFVARHSAELLLSNLPPSLSPRLLRTCMRYDWPGNLRELETFIKRYLVLGDDQLMIDELNQAMSDQEQEVELSAQTLLTAMQEAGGNRRVAAKALKISYKVLLHRLREFGMDRSPSPAWLT